MLKGKKISKKMAKLFLGLTLIGCCVATTSASAYSSTVSLSYNTYGGAGHVDGSKNGAYYNLSNAETKLDVTSKRGRGTIRVALIKGILTYGETEVDDVGVYNFGTVPKGKYHLFASGGESYTTMSIYGTLEQ